MDFDEIIYCCTNGLSKIFDIAIDIAIDIVTLENKRFRYS